MLYEQGGFNQMPSFDDWQGYGSWQGEALSSSGSSRQNYDHYVDMQNKWQAEGNVDRYNNNLELHGFYNPISRSEQLQFDIFGQQNDMEAARQARIREGTAAIDSQFSKFNDAFYQKRQDAYMDWANPQLDTQLQDNTRQLAYALARAGTTNSSSAARKQGDLQRMYDEGKAKLANTGLGYRSQAEADVASQKSQLYAQLNATSGAENAASQASAAAGLGAESLRNYQPIYDTLGDFFYGLTPSIGQAVGQAGIGAFSGYQNNKGPQVGDPSSIGAETVR